MKKVTLTAYNLTLSGIFVKLTEKQMESMYSNAKKLGWDEYTIQVECLKTGNEIELQNNDIHTLVYNEDSGELEFI